MMESENIVKMLPSVGRNLLNSITRVKIIHQINMSVGAVTYANKIHTISKCSIIFVNEMVDVWNRTVKLVESNSRAVHLD